jgi:hypothetical protein
MVWHLTVKITCCVFLHGLHSHYQLNCLTLHTYSSTGGRQRQTAKLMEVLVLSNTATLIQQNTVG